MKKLTVIISTFGPRVAFLDQLIQNENKQVIYIVVHQNHEGVQIPDFLKRDDVTVIQTKTKGLSKSRNIGLANCKTAYALLADDDVSFFGDSFDRVIDSLDRPDIDLAVFKIKTFDGEPAYKKYPTEPYILNDGAKHWVSSVEIAFKTVKVKEKGIYFDERFGLGTHLKSGEEQLFVNDSIKSGLICQFFNEYLVIHPFESSGKKNSSNIFKEFYKGAFAKRNGDFRINSKRFFSYFKHPSLLLRDFFYLVGFIYMAFKKKQIFL